MSLKNQMWLAVLVVFLVSIPTLAMGGEQDLSGIWVGELDLGAVKLELIFQLNQEEAGTYTGLLDVPAQGAKGIPLTFAGFQEGKVVFDVALIAGVFTGELNLASFELEGVWQQSGMNLPLTLALKEAGEIKGFNRPQEPQPPYPYSTEDVYYQNEEAGIKLAGTLTKPFGAGPFPVAILISGSGAQDRNEELMGHKPFLVIADHLTKVGVAVLRVDDRGFAESEGDFASATSLDFASDVVAGINYLKTRAEINSKQIGLIGHSEGGIIAPMVAAENADVAFIVLMAGPGLNGETISILQSALIQRALGVAEDLVAREQQLLRDALTINREVEDLNEAATLISKVFFDRFAELDEEERAQLGDLDALVEMQLGQLLSPWFRFFQTYDPMPALTKVTCPVLALNGSKDLQVPAAENLAKIEQALQAGGNENYTILELADLNHLFQTAETGAPGEYVLIEETISPVALEAMTEWILAVVE